MDKTTRKFRDISGTLTELNVAGLHAQRVHDLHTMHVGTVSQHVLRTSSVPENEAKNLVSGHSSSKRTPLLPSSTCLSNLVRSDARENSEAERRS